MMKRILRIYVNQKLFLGLIAVLCITMTYGCKLDNVKYGYLVIAHGNDAEWNTAVTDACQPLLDLDNMLFSICFLEDPWGEAGDTFILPQEGYDQLVNRGAEQIIVVPLFVSSHSTHIDEVKFVTNLGPLDDPEPEILDVVIVESSAPIVGITKAVDGHPAIGRELAPKVLSVDDDPSLDNYIVLISHGASTDEEDIYWYHDLDNILTELEANLTDDFATDTHVMTIQGMMKGWRSYVKFWTPSLTSVRSF